MDDESLSAMQHLDESEGTSGFFRIAVRFLIARRLDSLNLNNIFMNEWTRHKSLREYRGIGRVHVDTWKHERSTHDTRARY